MSVWIRLSLNESPIFQKMKEEGKTSKRPLSEAFGEWANAKIAILALFGATAGEAVVWYGGQFYALFFLTQTLKVPGATAQIMIVIALALGTPGFILFGWLSDKIGRKPIILAGFLLAALTYFPIFKGITHFANPKLEAALASSPVTVIADPIGMLVPVQGHGHREIHHELRYREVRTGQFVGELPEPGCAERHAGAGEDRRADAERGLAGFRQGVARSDQDPRLSGVSRSGRHQLA